MTAKGDPSKQPASLPNMVTMTALFVIATTLFATSTNGIEWLGLYRYHGYRHWNRTADCKLDTSLGDLQPHQNDVTLHSTIDVGGSRRGRSSKVGGMTFVRDQRRMCQRSLELMPSIVHAARTAVDVCQMQFHDARWNCSSVLSAPQLSADLTSGSREQAVVVALAAASLSQSIAKSCSSGMTTKCGCAGPSQSAHLASQAAGPTRDTATTHHGRFSTTSRPSPSSSAPSSADTRRAPQPHHSDTTGQSLPPSTPGQQQYQWGGCGDDVAYGLEFGQKFGAAKWIRRTPSIKSLNDLHNQRVGRKLLAGSLVTACKCHGVSGSCALKTCWRALPDMHVVGNIIARAYHESAVEVTSLPAGGGKRSLSLLSVRTGKEVAEDQLSYYNLSPDYCLPDALLGAVGTQGRECLKDHPGSAGCRSMCCGRRFTSETVTVRYRCDCKYHWCCYVKCRICSEQVEVHRCT